MLPFKIQSFQCVRFQSFQQYNDINAYFYVLHCDYIREYLVTTILQAPIRPQPSQLTWWKPITHLVDYTNGTKETAMATAGDTWPVFPRAQNIYKTQRRSNDLTFPVNVTISMQKCWSKGLPCYYDTSPIYHFFNKSIKRTSKIHRNISWQNTT